MRGLFVTGTDTGVGKTAVAAALLGWLRGRGVGVRAFKVVETGCEPDPDGILQPLDAEALWRAAGQPGARTEAVGATFREPLAPSVAAARVGVPLDIGALLGRARILGQSGDYVVVEGAGGWRVPLDDRRCMGDLARELGLPVLVVAANRLGALNHALLTVDAVLSAGLPLAGVVLNDPTRAGPGDLARDTNEGELRGWVDRLAGPSRFLGRVHFVQDGSPAAMADALPEAFRERLGALVAVESPS